MAVAPAYLCISYRIGDLLSGYRDDSETDHSALESVSFMKSTKIFLVGVDQSEREDTAETLESPLKRAHGRMSGTLAPSPPQPPLFAGLTGVWRCTCQELVRRWLCRYPVQGAVLSGNR